MSCTMKAIKINQLTKQYKNGVRALNGISLSVKQGEIFSLLGPNGAGKSSLINILTTYFSPTSGTVTMLGRDLVKEPAFIRQHIACAAQTVSIDEHLSLRENMLFQSRLYKVDKAAAQKRMNALIDSFELSAYLKYPVASYSGGVKRRLDIAMNMVSYPQILFLDEPTVGMDVSSRQAMWDIMRKTRDEFGTTIFLTTHYLEEADQLSDTICIIKEARELVQGTPANLRQYLRQNMLRISFSDGEQAKHYSNLLAEANLLPSIDVRGSSVFADAGDGRETFAAVNRWLLDKGVSFEAIEIVQPSLEDVFLKLTGTERK